MIQKNCVYKLYWRNFDIQNRKKNIDLDLKIFENNKKLKKINILEVLEKIWKKTQYKSFEIAKATIGISPETKNWAKPK